MLDSNFASPKVSIIVPVYNSEKYLDDTLESILAQDFKDIEVLLIDDGSTDNSGETCNKYSVKDSRFRVFHIPNGGVSAARNYALDRIKGEYVLFVDADDLIKPEYVKCMVDIAVERESPIITCRRMSGRYYTCDEFFRYKPNVNPLTVEIKLEQYRFTGKYRHDGIDSVMYSSDLLKDLRFSEDLYIGEDTLFFAQALKKAGRLVFVEESYYYYRFHESSAINSTYQKKHETEIIARERVCELFRDQSKAFINECESVLAVRCMKNYLRARKANYSDEEFLQEVYIKAYRRKWNVLRSTGYGKRIKLRFLLFCFFPDVNMFFYSE